MVYWVVEVTVYKTTIFLVVFFFKHKERVVALYTFVCLFAADPDDTLG